MKSVYEREDLRITEFDTEDVITTSGVDPIQPQQNPLEKENAYGLFGNFEQAPNSWF